MVYEFSRAYRLFSAGFRLHLALADLVSHACEIQIDETSGVAGHGYLVPGGCGGIAWRRETITPYWRINPNYFRT